MGGGVFNSIQHSYDGRGGREGKVHINTHHSTNSNKASYHRRYDTSRYCKVESSHKQR